MTGDRVEAVSLEGRILLIEQRQVFITGLWVAGLIVGQDAAYLAKGRLVPTSHQLGKEFERVREVVQLLTGTPQGKVPRLDKGTVQDAQQSDLINRGVRLDMAYPPGVARTACRTG
jgi:hypothetical protein